MQKLDTDTDDVGKFYKKYGVIYLKNGNENTNISIFRNLYESYFSNDILPFVWYALVAGIFILNILKIVITPEMMDTILKVFVSLCNTIIAVVCLVRTFKLDNTRKYFGIVVGIVSQLVVLATMFISVPRTNGPLLIIEIIDGLLVTIGCFIMFLDLVRYHNEIVLRQPPHLNKRGGDEIADRYNDNK
jgi:hypothetical protein